MKKINFLVFVVCVVLASCTIAPKDVSTSNLPTSNTEVTVPEFQHTYVNDYGDLLSQGETKTINRALRLYEDSTSTQIVVLTLASFDDQTNGPLFDYSKKIFSTWGIGQKNKNNGILLVVVKHLASKNAPGLRIVTGYGIEGALPDVTCKKIVESTRPLINEGKYEEGIKLAINKMQTEIKSEFTVAKTDGAKEPWTNGEIFVLVAFIIIVIALLVFFVFSSRDDESSNYYENSNSNHGYSSRRSSDNETPFIASTFISSSDSGSSWDSGSSDSGSSDSDSSCDCGGGDSGGGGGGD